MYGPEVLARLVELCEADAEREVCGFLVRRGGPLEVVPVPNAVDRWHDDDPEGFPRTSRDGYLMDPRALLALYRELDRCGGWIIAVWHSHVEADARLSARDREEALIEGRQVVPDAEYLVLGLRAGRVADVRRYRFEDGDFVEVPLR